MQYSEFPEHARRANRQAAGCCRCALLSGSDMALVDVHQNYLSANGLLHRLKNYLIIG